MWSEFCEVFAPSAEKSETEKLLEENIQLNKENEELKASILEWWEEHEYDTQGDFGEFSVYDEEPHFVRLAKK